MRLRGREHRGQDATIARSHERVEEARRPIEEPHTMTAAQDPTVAAMIEPLTDQELAGVDAFW